MVEFRWIIFSLFLMLLFSFTDSASRPYTVRVGDEVTLSCGNMIDDQEMCGSTTWFFKEFGKNDVILADHGQIHKDNKTKSDRLSVTENCSLVIKKVTAEDAGLYTCRLRKSGEPQDAQVYLSVVTMTEHNNNDKVTLNCSVSVYQYCDHTVKWLFEGKHVDEDNKDMETSQSECSVTVTFLSSYLKQKSEYHELFKCEVTDNYFNEVQQFNFSRQSSGDDATTTTTKSTSATRNKWTSVTMSLSERTNKTSTDNNNWTKQEGSWWIIIVSVGVATLLIITVTVIRWKRTKGNKTREDENMSQSLNPAVTQSAPETSEDTADPEDGVSYASISYIKKTNSRAQVRGHDDDDDEGDTVTYSTVKVVSSSAAASADPSSLYAAVNKPER